MSANVSFIIYIMVVEVPVFINIKWKASITNMLGRIFLGIMILTSLLGEHSAAGNGLVGELLHNIGAYDRAGAFAFVEKNSDRGILRGKHGSTGISIFSGNKGFGFGFHKTVSVSELSLPGLIIFFFDPAGMFIFIERRRLMLVRSDASPPCHA